MRPAAILVLLFASTFAFGQTQTEDQKALMDRHKAVLTSAAGEKKASDGEAIITRLLASQYLLKRKASVPFMEDIIIECRKNGRKELWRETLMYYAEFIPIEDMPDKMVPEFAEFMKINGLAIVSFRSSAISPEYYAEFGPRGIVFIPILEGIRDASKDDAVFRQTNALIRQLKQSQK